MKMMTTHLLVSSSGAPSAMGMSQLLAVQASLPKTSQVRNATVVLSAGQLVRGSTSGAGTPTTSLTAQDISGETLAVTVAAVCPWSVASVMVMSQLLAVQAQAALLTMVQVQ